MIDTTVECTTFCGKIIHIFIARGDRNFEEIFYPPIQDFFPVVRKKSSSGAVTFWRVTKIKDTLVVLQNKVTKSELILRYHEPIVFHPSVSSIEYFLNGNLKSKKLVLANGKTESI